MDRTEQPLVERAVIERVLAEGLRRGADFAEVFAEDRTSNNARFDDGRVEELVTGRERGVGIRVLRGESTGFAHTSDLSERGLLDAAAAAATAANAQATGGSSATAKAHDLTADIGHRLPSSEVPRATITKERKIEMLQRADDAARSVGREIAQVAVSYADSFRRILVANSDGLYTDDEQERTRFMVQCVALGDTGRQTSHEGPGNTVGFDLFERFAPEDVATIAATRAIAMLDSRPAPSGKVPIVLKRGAGGVMFHEACGHGLEADLVARDASVFKGKIGQRVASKGVTVVDDGLFGREWGSARIDDEGQPSRRNVLLEDGVLTDYMWDLIRARKEGRPSSGNGRRQSYQYLPMVRMTNTYLEAGDEDPDEIIRQTPYGVYCVQLGGGQVNTATGDFVFGITEAYMIENGEITHPIRAANLIGNGPEVLQRIDAIGRDFDTWAGTCGKDGQGVPVSSGQPTLRISEMTIGGTAGA